MRFPLLFLQAVVLCDALGVLAFQSTCVKEFAASSLAVMTAGVMSTFTITATDYPGNPCTIGSEMFGFNLMPFPGNVSLSGRFNSQWSVTPPNQFVLPLLLTSSAVYSAEIVRFGASTLVHRITLRISPLNLEQAAALAPHITKIYSSANLQLCQEWTPTSTSTGTTAPSRPPQLTMSPFAGPARFARRGPSCTRSSLSQTKALACGSTTISL
jgi:hypothetical protein